MPTHAQVLPWERVLYANTFAFLILLAAIMLWNTLFNMVRAAAAAPPTLPESALHRGTCRIPAHRQCPKRAEWLIILLRCGCAVGAAGVNHACGPEPHDRGVAGGAPPLNQHALRTTSSAQIIGPAQLV